MNEYVAAVTTAPQDRVGSPQATMRDAVQNALQKLGLRLEPRKAPVETIVVDHVERTPTEN